MNEASTIFSLIHRTLSGGENELSVSMMCQTAGVSRSGYYAWLNAASARQVREAQDRADFELVLEAYNRRRYSKGARGIYMCLIHNTPPVVMNLKKIRRLMKKYGLQCPIRRANPYRKMKNAMKTNHYAPNLLDREFESYGPRLVLLTDITYIPWGGSFLYLCVIMDAYTKQVLSYTLSPSLEVDFVLDAVDILMREHGVSLHAETVIHSDQGCHYTSCKFIELVEHNELRRSMYNTMKMKPTFRYDSRPWTPPEGARYVTPEDAATAMLDTSNGSEADRARLRMLERQQRHGRSESAAAARLNMIRRQAEEHRQRNERGFPPARSLLSYRLSRGVSMCQRRCDFVVFRRTGYVEKWRVMVYSLCIIILAVFVRQA